MILFIGFGLGDAATTNLPEILEFLIQSTLNHSEQINSKISNQLQSHKENLHLQLESNDSFKFIKNSLLNRLESFNPNILSLFALSEVYTLVILHKTHGLNPCKELPHFRVCKRQVLHT